MKTPRQILLERHRNAEARLDAIRQDVLAALRKAPAREPRPLASLTLRDAVLSLRWHLVGLGAAWLVVLLLNIAPSPSLPAATQRQNPPSSRQIVTALLENRRQVMEMIETPVVETPTGSRNRSELRPGLELV